MIETNDADVYYVYRANTWKYYFIMTVKKYKITLYSNSISETYLIKLSASNMTRGKWDRTAKLFITA